MKVISGLVLMRKMNYGKSVADKKIETIPSLYQGKLLNGPNDLWIDRKGGVYFTDPFYRRAWWNHKEMPQDIQAVYYLSPDHKTITRLTDDLQQPNGIVGTPDGKNYLLRISKQIKPGLTISKKTGVFRGRHSFANSDPMG